MGESYLMNTNMTGFRQFSKFVFCFSGYPGAPPDVLPQARRDMDVVLEEKKHMIRYIVQDIYEFSDR